MASRRICFCASLSGILTTTDRVLGQFVQDTIAADDPALTSRGWMPWHTQCGEVPFASTARVRLRIFGEAPGPTGRQSLDESMRATRKPRSFSDRRMCKSMYSYVPRCARSRLGAFSFLALFQPLLQLS